MMTTERKAKLAAGALTGLLAIAIFSGTYFYRNGEAWKKEADHARLSIDSLTAVRQLLDKEIDQTKADLAAAKGKNTQLDQQVANLEATLAEKEATIKKLLAENATVQSLRRQLSDLKQQRETLNRRIRELEDENGRLKSENSRLAESVAQLGREKQSLEEQLTATQKSAKAQDFRVELLRTKSKVTVKARRARSIDLSFEWPAQAAGGKTNVYLVLLDPQGQPVKNKGTQAVTAGGQTLWPLKTQVIDASKGRADFPVKLEQKLKKGGVYKVQVYTDEGLIGSTQVRLN